MAAFFHDFSCIHYQNSICRRNRAEAVRYHERRQALSAKRRECLLNGKLRFAVECAGGFVQHEELRLAVERSCDGKALTLPAGED